MELKERISAIIKENHLKQKELASLIGVTESYISTLLSGRNQNISVSVAKLLEEKLGYNAQWLLSGEDPKYKQLSASPDISDAHRQALLQLEKMSDREIEAVLAFINSLEEIEKSLSANSDKN